MVTGHIRNIYDFFATKPRNYYQTQPSQTLTPSSNVHIFFQGKTPMKKSICRGLMYDYFKPIGESSDKYIRSLLNVMMVSKNIYYVR